MPNIQLSFIDYLILAVYFAFVLGIGWALKRYMKSSSDFFLSGRSIPAWITGLAFISANLGAQEVIGMGASGAKYGIMTSHFYWVGAIPAMVFVGIFMMPFYYGSQVRSVPEYLKAPVRRKDPRLQRDLLRRDDRLLLRHLAVCDGTAARRRCSDWDFHFSILVSAVIVLVYIFLGGLTSAIYNEVLQFFLIVFGFAAAGVPRPAGRRRLGGLHKRLTTVATSNGFAAGAWSHSWDILGSASANPMGVEWFGMVMGLGFVLSFGYWCTDFLSCSGPWQPTRCRPRAGRRSSPPSPRCSSRSSSSCRA